MSAASRLLRQRRGVLARKAVVGLALALLAVATSTSIASAACNPPKFASTYDPTTGFNVYWTTTITDANATLLGKFWTGTTDHTGTCNQDQPFLYFAVVTPGTVGMTLSLGASCVVGCPSGSLSLDARVIDTSRTQEQMLMIKVPETPQGVLKFNFSHVAYHFCDAPRPEIIAVQSNGTAKIVTLSIGSMTSCAFGGALQEITGWNILSAASSTDPGVFGSYGLRGSLAVAAGSDGSASGTVQLDCSDPTLDQWVTAQVVTNGGGVTHLVGPTTRVSCRTVATQCLGFPNGTSCDDGNACTAGDVCTGGVCNGTPLTAPPEVQNVTADSDKATYSWAAAAYATWYDVVRGSLTGLPVGSDGGDELCYNDLTGTSLSNSAIPEPGGGFWYLARGENGCGIGTFGDQSNGSPRTTTTCP